MTQVTRRLATVLAFSALLTAPRSAYSSESGGWYPGFEDAQRSASDSGQPLLLHFHATYCGPCRRMNREVFGEPDVQQRLRNGIAAAEVDVSEHPEIAQRYGASTVPRDVVVFPDGSIETVNVGFMPRAAYMSMLASIADRGYTMAAARQRQLDLQRQSDQQITPESAQAIVATDSGDDAPNDTADVSRTEDDSVLGLEGFCPVRLHEDREWVKGSPEFTDTHHGVVYYFSGQKELQE
ncbi:MAG: thioredoxin family protein, partial [Planctomycetaceae bacterium]|nr:thioredoxin family protein [Planctomycetaceae bacterium]